jgi:hypothetical protein
MQTDWQSVCALLKAGLITEQGIVQLMSDRKYPILSNPPIWTSETTLKCVRLVQKHLEPIWMQKEG